MKEAGERLDCSGRHSQPIIDKINKEVAEIVRAAGGSRKTRGPADGAGWLFSERIARPYGWRYRALGTGDQSGEREIELGRLVLNILDVGEGNSRRAFPGVVEDKLIASHEHLVIVEVLGTTRVVSLHEILEFFFVCRGNPAR